MHFKLQLDFWTSTTQKKKRKKERKQLRCYIKICLLKLGSVRKEICRIMLYIILLLI